VTEPARPGIPLVNNEFVDVDMIRLVTLAIYSRTTTHSEVIHLDGERATPRCGQTAPPTASQAGASALMNLKACSPILSFSPRTRFALKLHSFVHDRTLPSKA